MQLIIEIQDKLFEYITKGKDLSEEQNDEMALSIANGTPLPKGHGRLIDASQLFTVTECRPDGTVFTYVPYTSIENAEAVIEADKEVENG